ncbi:hypothetical protein [Capsulimonas corticalis]
MSVRAYDSILKFARTVADLDAATDIGVGTCGGGDPVSRAGSEGVGVR